MSIISKVVRLLNEVGEQHLEERRVLQINPSAPDCPSYFDTQQCNEGRKCSLRHCKEALQSLSTCKYWKNTQCTNKTCSFRHVSESELLCAFNGKCNNTECPYKHTETRTLLDGQPALKNVCDLLDLLAHFNLQNFWDYFVKKNVDLTVFLAMSEKDFKDEMPSIEFADRRRLMIAQKKYQDFLDQKKIKNEKPKQKAPGVKHQKSKSDRNVYVKYLDEEVTENILRQYFSPFGTISICKVIRSESGQSKGYGFVYFTTKDEATKAIASMNGTKILSKNIYVAFADMDNERVPRVVEQAPQSEQRPINDQKAAGVMLQKPKDKSDTNVYVKFLDEEVTEQLLRQNFSPFGSVTTCKVIRSESGQSKGYGFVYFTTKDEATKAIASMNGTKILSKNIYVAFADMDNERVPRVVEQAPQSEQRPTNDQKAAGVMLQKPKYKSDTNVYVKSLDEEVTEQLLRQNFSPFGSVTACKVIRFENGRSKGYGFVNFTTKEEATRAIAYMNGTTILSKKIYVAFADMENEKVPRGVKQVPKSDQRPSDANTNEAALQRTSRSPPEESMFVGDGRQLRAEIAAIQRLNEGATHATNQLHAGHGGAKPKTVSRPPRTQPTVASQISTPLKHGDCVVCMGDQADVALVPCGHISMCEKCAACVRTQSNQCPICRKQIENVVKTYYSVGN